MSAALSHKQAAALCALVNERMAGDLAMIRAKTTHSPEDARVVPWIERCVAAEFTLAMLVGAIGGESAEMALRALLNLNAGSDYFYGYVLRQEAETRARLHKVPA